MTEDYRIELLTMHDDGSIKNWEEQLWACDRECLGIALSKNGLPIDVVTENGNGPTVTIGPDDYAPHVGQYRACDYQLLDTGTVFVGGCATADTGPEDTPLPDMPDCPGHRGAQWCYLMEGPETEDGVQSCEGCGSTIEPEDYCGCGECDCATCNPDGPPDCGYQYCGICYPQDGEGSEESGGSVLGSLTAVMPALNLFVPRPCECGGNDSLANVIVHLNDSETHREDWPREAVADWLDGPPNDSDGVPLDLTFKTPGVDPCGEAGSFYLPAFHCGPNVYGESRTVAMVCHLRFKHEGSHCYDPACPGLRAEEIESALAAPEADTA